MTEQERENLMCWWANEPQERPVIVANVVHVGPPEITDVAAWWASNEMRWAAYQNTHAHTDYHGCGAPIHYVDFGASCMAGCLGCEMNPLTHDTIWPSHRYQTIQECQSAALQTESAWYRNVYALLDTSLADREVFTTLYALGGVYDTLGSLYGEQNLLLDMVDHPALVKRAAKHILGIWLAECGRQNERIRAAGQPGYAGWAGIWAPGTTFPIQEDMSYMISAEMFREFCLPNIAAMADALAYPMYHLDGRGAVKHLDAVLALSNLPVIQWVAGAGNEELVQWYPLIERILAAGKSIQLYARAEEVLPIVRRFGPTGLLFTISDATEDSVALLIRQGLLKE